MLWSAPFCVALAVSESVSVEPKAFVVEVGRVSVSQYRPGTNKTWDTVDETRKANGDDLLCDFLQHALPMGKVGSLLCR